MIRSIVFLGIANVFMTYAWYGHLKDFRNKPLIIAILVSWGVAFIEYCFQVPANRLGSNYFSLPQLKVVQEIITMAVFGVFALIYMNVPVTKNYILASICLIGAAYFIFRDGMTK